MSVTVSINGAHHDLPDHGTVLDAIAALGIGPETPGVAVAVDSEVVPRQRWGTRALSAGVQIEVVRAAAGG